MLQRWWASNYTKRISTTRICCGPGSHHIIYKDALVFVIDAIEYGVCHRYVKAIRVSLRTLEKFLVASPGCLFQKLSKA